MRAPKSESLSYAQDIKLVEAIVSGNEDGFEELVRRYHRPLVIYIYKMLGDYETALDITQEVFLKVHNSISQYSSAYKFSTWLYRIAHNAAVDYIRCNQNKEKSFDREESKIRSIQPTVNNPSPETESEIKELLSEIQTVIKHLPASYRELIILRHGKDLSYEEIVEITGLPLGTVKNRLFRAREMLREMLARRGFQRS